MSQYDSKLFQLEENISLGAFELTKDPKYQDNPLLKDYEKLAKHYLKLLRQTKKLVKMSDFQQLKLNQANQELQILSEQSSLAYKELNQVYSILKKDLNFAQQLQESILTKPRGKIFNRSFFAHYEPISEIGGDIYDIEEIFDKKIRIFLADAAGHGVRAALVTMIIKAEYESLKRTHYNPNELLKILNNQFLESFYSLNVFFTAIIADIDITNNKLFYCSAGHPPQYLITPGGVKPLHSNGKPIGILADIEYPLKELPFCSDDKLLLFSDGFFEQFNMEEEEYGEERLYKLVLKNRNKNISEIVKLAMSELEIFLNGSKIHDDITILGVE
ncbi:MAG: serine/threonine-protein phosphatase [Leptospiraceae bacterium]|nr:serine/threonine-protein phosphatase [Leptospiraceae bacterium]MCP5495054.1 serine/threonine-protein phosphatase [Leptospiraceae bacterium]